MTSVVSFLDPGAARRPAAAGERHDAPRALTIRFAIAVWRPTSLSTKAMPARPGTGRLGLAIDRREQFVGARRSPPPVRGIARRAMQLDEEQHDAGAAACAEIGGDRPAVGRGGATSCRSAWRPRMPDEPGRLDRDREVRAIAGGREGRRTRGGTWRSDQRSYHAPRASCPRRLTTLRCALAVHDLRHELAILGDR
jgi:hypothetical protein